MHLILLPGMDGTGALFAPLMAALPGDIRAHAISYPTDRALTYAQLVERVLPLLPRDAPFVILGESFSGPVAIGLAHRRPPGLAGVILCVTFARSTRPRMPQLPVPASWGATFTKWSLNVSRAAWVWRMLLGKDFSRDRHRMIQGAVDRNTPEVLVSRIHEMSIVDVTDAVAEMNVPTLYLHAKQDRIVPRKAGELIVTANPAVRIRELEGSHFVLQAHPEAAAAMITAFCRNPAG